jgi:hypothetical protein
MLTVDVKGRGVPTKAAVRTAPDWDAASPSEPPAVKFDWIRWKSYRESSTPPTSTVSVLATWSGLLPAVEQKQADEAGLCIRAAGNPRRPLSASPQHPPRHFGLKCLPSLDFSTSPSTLVSLTASVTAHDRPVMAPSSSTVKTMRPMEAHLSHVLRSSEFRRFSTSDATCKRGGKQVGEDKRGWGEGAQGGAGGLAAKRQPHLHLLFIVYLHLSLLPRRTKWPAGCVRIWATTFGRRHAANVQPGLKADKVPPIKCLIY